MAPLAAVMRVLAPGLDACQLGLEVTSARHSSRPLRTMRNSSVPVPSTAPTVAVRAEIMPLSGAQHLREPQAAVPARLQQVRGRIPRAPCAVCSAVVNCWICCWLNAPEVCSEPGALGVGGGFGGHGPGLRSRWRGLAPHRPAPCPTAKRGQHLAGLHHVAHVHTARRSRRRPLLSAPMLASCQAAMLPLAARRSGRLHALGLRRAHGERWPCGVCGRLGFIGWHAMVPERTASAPPVLPRTTAGGNQGRRRGGKEKEECCMCICPEKFISAVHGIGQKRHSAHCAPAMALAVGGKGPPGVSHRRPSRPRPRGTAQSRPAGARAASASRARSLPPALYAGRPPARPGWPGLRASAPSVASRRRAVAARPQCGALSLRARRWPCRRTSACSTSLTAWRALGVGTAWPLRS
jgi:hypothetical protein